MHFQVIKDNYYNRILERIKEYFPDFCSVFDIQDGVYPILGELGSYIVDHFNYDKVKNSAISFVNEAIEQGGGETEDAIVLELFQRFYANVTLSDQIRKHLNSKALDIFDRYFEEFNNYIEE